MPDLLGSVQRALALSSARAAHATRGPRALQDLGAPIRGLADPSHAVRHRHPRYTDWAPTWRELGYLYEGDGPYRSGAALTPHPRELQYKVDAAGDVDFNTVTGETRKLTLRRKIASYENLAQVVIDTVTEYQYVRNPTRTETAGEGESGHARQYFEWLKNVDGMGTPMNEWLEYHQSLANLYGHLVVVMDRVESILGRPPRSAAEVPPLALRAYIPAHVPDWLTRRGELVGVKVIDPVERRSLFETPYTADDLFRTDGVTESGIPIEYRFWDETGWQRFTIDGVRRDSDTHGIGEVPAVIFYSRKRAGIPIIGRSYLRDPRVYREHYELLSELRELLRSNTFSHLHIQLGPNETAEQAKLRLGDYVSSSSVTFSVGGATYVAPPDGPIRAYFDAIQRVERAIYRMASLPYENDSLAGEAAESRRMKALGLNRTLSRQADNAEYFERRIARLWFMLTYGRDAGLRRLDASGLRITHPDEFFVQQIADVASEARTLLDLGLGPHANRLIKLGVVPTGLPGLSEEDMRIVKEDLEAAEARDRERAATELEREQQEDAEAAAVGRTVQQEAARARRSVPGGPPTPSASGASPPPRRDANQPAPVRGVGRERDRRGGR